MANAIVKAAVSKRFTPTSQIYAYIYEEEN